MTRFIVALVGVYAGLCLAVQPALAADSAAEIFTRRILPLARAEKPSSCAECHVAGVDLSQYVRSDAAATFAALRAAGARLFTGPGPAWWAVGYARQLQLAAASEAAPSGAADLGLAHSTASPSLKLEPGLRSTTSPSVRPLRISR